MKPINSENPIIQEDIATILANDLPWDKFERSTVLITGASGMLASYMVFVLAAWMKEHPNCGTKLYLAVHSREKATVRFGAILEMPEIKLMDWQGVEELHPSERIDYIIHAASSTDSAGSITHPVETALPNVIGVWRLLELARHDRSKGFLFFSSEKIYGTVNAAQPIREEDCTHLQPQNIRSCYGESKRMAENLCAYYFSEYQVPTCCVRSGYTYGPSIDLDKDRRMFADFARSVVRKEDIAIKSDGSAVRSFCYITDAVHAFFRLLLMGKPGVSYNMCNDTQVASIGQLAETIVKLFPEKGLSVTWQAQSARNNLSDHKSTNPQPMDTRKLRALGWKPCVTIQEGFQRTITAFLE